MVHFKSWQKVLSNSKLHDALFTIASAISWWNLFIYNVVCNIWSRETSFFLADKTKHCIFIQQKGTMLNFNFCKDVVGQQIQLVRSVFGWDFSNVGIIQFVDFYVLRFCWSHFDPWVAVIASCKLQIPWLKIHKSHHLTPLLQNNGVSVWMKIYLNFIFIHQQCKQIPNRRALGSFASWWMWRRGLNLSFIFSKTE